MISSPCSSHDTSKTPVACAGKGNGKGGKGWRRGMGCDTLVGRRSRRICVSEGFVPYIANNGKFQGSQLWKTADGFCECFL